MRNYDKTLAISAALGLDADLAKVAVKSTDALLPGFMKKSVFGYAMQTALSTLKSMENYKYEHNTSNVYANMRIKALQRIIQDKRSLPLIFPQEDIAFSYHNKSVPSGSSTHGFLVGARLPHKWVLLSAGREHLHCALSLVDIPHIAYILKSMQAWSKPKEHVVTPPHVVLISEDKQFFLLDAYRTLPRECRDQIMIAIVHRKEKLCDPDGVIENLLSSDMPNTKAIVAKTNCHHILQSQLQVPNFNIPKHTLSANMIKNKSLQFYNHEKLVSEKQEEMRNTFRNNYEETSSLLGKLTGIEETDIKARNPVAWQQYVSVVGDVKIIRLYDVGETWFSGDRVGVVSVRPDGHVHSVLPPSAPFDHTETMTRYLQSITQDLNM